MNVPAWRGLRWRYSLAFRIAFTSALFGLVLAGGAIVLEYWSLAQQLDDKAAMEMQGRRKLLEHILSTFPSVGAIAGAEARFGDLFYGHDDLHLALVDPRTDRVVMRSSDIAVQSLTPQRHAAAADEIMHGWSTPDGARYAGLHGTAAVSNGSQVRFYLSADRHRDAALLAGFLKATLLALPLLLFMVASGAGLIASTGLLPLRRFNSLAATIGAKSLSNRVSMAGLPRELEDTASFSGFIGAHMSPRRICHGVIRHGITPALETPS